MDPELKEECVIDGRITITMNVHRELCGVQKSGIILALAYNLLFIATTQRWKRNKSGKCSTLFKNRCH